MLSIRSVSKAYQLFRTPAERLASSLPFAQREVPQHWALRDVSFSVAPGETLAIIGANGSGKSTLLQIVAGIIAPTSGEVAASGRIAALLELGAGFNPDFTGRENVLLYGELHGFTQAATHARFAAIEEFASIGPFIDRPVREYSSGMYVRLAFSAAIHVDPSILIVDEALAVGDVRFANRCIRRFEQMKSAGTTILFVSHDLGLVKRLADRVALLVDGRVDAIGTPSDVVNRYIGQVIGRDQEHDETASRTIRHGDGTSEISAATLTRDDGGDPAQIEPGEIVTITVEARFHSPCDNPMVGVLIRNRLGVDVYGTNTREEGVILGSFAAGDAVCVAFRFPCTLTRQAYTVTVAVQHHDGRSQDWRDDALAFAVVDSRELAGVVDLRATITWSRS